MENVLPEDTLFFELHRMAESEVERIAKRTLGTRATSIWALPRAAHPVAPLKGAASASTEEVCVHSPSHLLSYNNQRRLSRRKEHDVVTPLVEEPAPTKYRTTPDNKSMICSVTFMFLLDVRMLGMRN